ncbi:histidine kinase [Sphaerisporangium sp. TRM90804]|uniref:sensor histidine kinase n=1 Tax=Sphaerisporangium sp. TRM90804 TaxID=3031113 RepID=UPI00244BE306|nr:histidine kinase [Sphaerisporangium sp. TRM90804]MDH2426343.1 histidine kinase [Sphaerisporangium sp. TRM90804]
MTSRSALAHDRNPGRAGQVAMVAVTAAYACLQVLLYAGGQRTSGALGPAAELVFNLVIDGLLLLMPSRPRTAGVLVVLGAVVAQAAALAAPGLLTSTDALFAGPAPLATPAAVWILAYLRPTPTGFACVCALALLNIQPWAPTWTGLYVGAVYAVLPAVTAMYLRARARLLHSLRERVEIAERERHLLNERAIAAERQHLAAEMHDVVTHHVTEIVLRAGALRTSTEDEAVRAAARRIGDLGSRTMVELRDLIGVMRSGEWAAPAQETYGHGQDGRRAARRSTGDRGGDPAELTAAAGASLRVGGDPGTASPVIRRAAYRVVQEALTNVRKHAPGARVTVDLRYHPEAVSVEILNTAPTAPTDPSLVASGSRAGLTGLRRRVSLLGGTLRSGPTEQGGYRVTASLPASVPAEDHGERPTRAQSSPPRAPT